VIAETTLGDSVQSKRYFAILKPKMRCFITVGTTKFDALIELLLEEKILLFLHSLGFRELSIQSGDYQMESCLNRLEYVHQVSERNGNLYAKSHGLNIRSRDYFPSIAQEMRNADLIIGHAGAGTCMEALSFAKPLLVVVNNKLLNNHQSELAERLAIDEYCLIANSPDNLLAALENPRLLNPSAFPRTTNESTFIEFVDKVMNFS